MSLEPTRCLDITFGFLERRGVVGTVNTGLGPGLGPVHGPTVLLRVLF